MEICDKSSGMIRWAGSFIYTKISPFQSIHEESILELLYFICV